MRGAEGVIWATRRPRRLPCATSAAPPHARSVSPVCQSKCVCGRGTLVTAAHAPCRPGKVSGFTSNLQIACTKLRMKSALQKKKSAPASPAPAGGLVLSLSKPAVTAVLGVEPWPPRAFSRPQFHQSLFSHLPPQPPWVPQSAGTIIPWIVSSEINTAHAPHVDRSLRTAQPCSIKGALTRWGKRPRSLPRPPR